MTQTAKRPTLALALLPILFLVILLSVNVIFVFQDDALSGSNQIILILSAAVAAIVGLAVNVKWTTMLAGIVKSISTALPSILILLLIGSLAGTWLISGIVPALIYYGLDVLHPTYFLFAACIICSVVSMATGSSWTTIATIGIALIAIGKALGMSEGIVAGAIISGAYFGDKMSPLSDTTNLASAMAGTELFVHIRYMMFTTLPSIVITLVIFLVIGFNYEVSPTAVDVSTVKAAIEQSFNITGWLFIVPLVVVILIVTKVPPIPALLAGVLLGGIFAIIFQPELLTSLANEGDNLAKGYYRVVMTSIYGDISIPSNNEAVSDLLSTGGMAGMLYTIWLIISAMVFGGVMEACGFLKRITEAIISVVHSEGSLIASTALTAFGFNVTASDQYLAIVVPGRMFADTFRERGLKPENLSRTLEDSGTVTSVLVPWNTCGATQATVLGVATLTYLPFCFFNIISPFMTILYGYLGIKIARYPKERD